MGADEWPSWVAFDQLSPIGDDVNRCLLGQILQLLANVHRDPNKSPAIELDRVLPFLGARKATLDQVDQGAIAIDPRVAAIRQRALTSRNADGP